MPTDIQELAQLVQHALAKPTPTTAVRMGNGKSYILAIVQYTGHARALPTQCPRIKLRVFSVADLFDACRQNGESGGQTAGAMCRAGSRRNWLVPRAAALPHRWVRSCSNRATISSIFWSHQNLHDHASPSHACCDPCCDDPCCYGP
ncbi:hypothetical protein [Pseudoalteromonas lipolytica]|uniref:hypothetical protein n=1 Tax=Pseudoalteromonas lipolytica TaxID=570156 RepID=UPI0013C34FCD|nr:hypothetical protein [Pseudoalteromonas donghaensis]